MSKVNIREVVNQGQQVGVPWDLTLTINGQDFVTQRPTTATVAGLRAVGELKDEDVFALLDQCFVDPPPPLRAWHAAKAVLDDDMLAIVQAIDLQVRELAAKNSYAVAGAICLAAGHQLVKPLMPRTT